MDKIGTRIIIERKGSGLTLKQFAKKGDINSITLHTIETDEMKTIPVRDMGAEDVRRTFFYCRFGLNF